MLVLLLLGCGGGSGSKPTQRTTPAVAAPQPAPARSALYRVELNGTTLTYRQTGQSGPALVFIHGSLGNISTWNAQDTSFARLYRVLVYSRRYHPPNPPVDDAQPYSPKLHAEDLAALLLRLELAPAHIVGADYGAYTALVLAREHPDLVRSLVIAEPPIVSLLSNMEAGDTLRRAFLGGSLDAARAAFAHGDSVAALRAFLSGSGASFDRSSDAARANLLAHSFELRREMLTNREQYLPPLGCADLGRLNTAVLIVRGERSPRIYQVISDELARCMRNDTTAVIPAAGHAMHAAQPGYYNTVVSRFLSAR